MVWLEIPQELGLEYMIGTCSSTRAGVGCIEFSVEPGAKAMELKSILNQQLSLLRKVVMSQTHPLCIVSATCSRENGRFESKILPLVPNVTRANPRILRTSRVTIAERKAI